MSQMPTMTDFTVASAPPQVAATARNRIPAVFAAIGSALQRRRDAWRFYRMAAADPRIFQDIGVGRGEAEHAMRCGRPSATTR
ncbi:MAG: hypothetical protein ABI399_08205 [Bauldia sp.]